MHPFDQKIAPPSSWLTLIGSELVEVPEGLSREVEQLRKALRKGLLGRYEELETLLEELLPRVWELRIRALPLLAQTDLAEALKKVEVEFSLMPQRFPALAEAAIKLLFGLHLMTGFVEKLLATNPEITTKLPQRLSADKMPTLEEIKGLALSKSGNEVLAYNLIQGSLLMDLLFFAMDLAADEHLPLDVGICYELEYQSAIAVKTYAAAFGMDKTQMPWYVPPQNTLEKILLEGPVVSEADVEYVHEKRAHLNTWK